MWVILIFLYKQHRRELMDCFDGNITDVECKDGKVEAVHDLLEESWFFGTFLKSSKPRMLRSYSDPTTTTDASSSKKMSGILARTPSMPPCIGREDRIQRLVLSRQLSDKSLVQEARAGDHCIEKRKVISQEMRRSKMVVSNGAARKSSQGSGLQRAPSLPPCTRREEEIESDITMSELIRQAMPNSLEGMKKFKAQGRKEMQRWNLKKSVSNLEFQELEGLKLGWDLGNPKIPTWSHKKSTQQDDMKAQLKFWARAVVVASKVR